ncbi:ribonuclease R [Apibacter sp. B2912]|uniref:ribonuclease R n=1 Tax=Apibacter sp. B2912 TaxID=2656763 RepID=UPI00136F9203|nr:ribonuclease R [Apibacter sp. B2912]MXO33007.1 ribonuclease R [Apibacter sp. B2912]
MTKKKRIISTKHKEKLRNLKRNILNIFIKNPNKQYNYKQISTILDYKNPRQREFVIQGLLSLVSEKQLTEIKTGKYQINSIKESVTGKIDFSQNGNAYLIVEGLEKDIFIPKGKTGKALQNDMVKVIVHQFKNRKPEGEVIEILERYKTKFVAKFEYSPNKNFGFAVVNKPSVHTDFFIPKDKFNGAKNGQLVVVQLLDWQDKEDSPTGSIVEVLGDPGENETEIHAILSEYGLPYTFPYEVEKEAEKLDIRISEDEISKRRDMRTVTTFTIDPVDAKDFDDALSIEKLDNGNWEIGIHIADVSHYVKPGTLLDKEAYLRGTSVYLVDRVVPMLPEVLSNNVCSLRPKEDKYTFSAVFELDEKAQVKKQWFGRTVIHSDRRFTYEEAQEIIEGKKGDFEEEIHTLNNLAKLLREDRMNKGAISFDKIEVKFNLDENKNPVGVYFKIGKDSNHLIEEFMLLANKKVSEYVSTNKKGNPTDRTFIYRIHDDPDPIKLLSLKQFVNTLGYDINITNKNKTYQSINKLLADVKGKGEENMIETLTIRTMSKAKYSTENVGHYGLAFDYYSHFTSPIRRYPDVIAHRLLQDFLDKKPSANKEIIENMAKHCSNMEKLAADAERDSIKYMQVKFMEKHLGESFEGVITGVTEYGIYVEIKEFGTEGMIKTRDIRDDEYRYDEKTYSIIGQRTGNQYQLGDTVFIKVIKANLEKKQLDFELIEN